MQQAVIIVRYYKQDRHYQQQLNVLRGIAREQSLWIISELVEKISGFRSLQEPNGLDQVRRLSRQGRLQKVLVGGITQLGRSPDEIRQLINELTQASVSIYIHNAGLETLVNGQPNPAAQLLVTTLADLSRLEQEVLRDRMAYCLQQEQRRTQQQTRSQRKISPAYLVKYPAVVRNLRTGLSLRKTAKLCAVSIGTVQRVSHYLFGTFY